MNQEQDPNEHEIDPPPTDEERELGARAVEYVRRQRDKQQSGAL